MPGSPPAVDHLTGAFGRAEFDRRWPAVLARARAQGGSCALLVIDLDHFKAINDGFGHARGDAVLQEAVRRIRQATRSSDDLYRWGGDEFVLVLTGADLDAGRHVVQRLQATMRERPWQRHAAGLQVTLSIGLAALAEGQTIDDALAVADQALYAAKRGGRDQAVW